jgi:hypothetical protein
MENRRFSFSDFLVSRSVLTNLKSFGCIVFDYENRRVNFGGNLNDSKAKDRRPGAAIHAAKLRPKEFYDLVIEVAIVRHSSIQGDMVHPYLRRRNNKEAVEYQSEELRWILGRTLGVPLF